MSTRLIIARHGNTFEAGEAPRRAGRTDLPLVEKGREQGRLLGAYLLQHDAVPAAIFTSRLQRTQQTAAQAQQVMGSQCVPQVLAWLDEINHGPDENQSEDKVRARLGEAALRAWDMHAQLPADWQLDIPQLIADWQQFAAQLCQDYLDQTVLVVTSNGIARFAGHLTGDFAAFQNQFGIKLATGALGIFEQDAGSSHWHCRAWNLRPA